MPDLLDRTTPLLTRITQESLDGDYQHVADRRAAAGDGRPSSRRNRLTASIVVGAFGLLVAVAAVQTDEQSGVTSASRASLIDQINDQRDRLADLQARTVSLRELNIGLQDDFDETNDKATAAEARAQRLAAQTGFAAVTGPGIVITVDDAPDGEAVRDSDLSLLVDGLWNAGAEAISINGKRLTARSALRNSGPAINLNGPPPLSPPYVVSAIGNKDTLQADLLDTDSGLAFTSLAESFGFPVSMDNEDELTLPAAAPRMLRLPTIEAARDAQSDKNRKETTE
ncbi:DUF881 domain-containing protein [Nocardioides mangrovi]|uniref:DUF881 domain-containing protein n=1 Tax=Nocardioides mangrovi TaxID=2874580 RepID=A0ABS7UD54_9ACTN|nr:DUF881 domain-containing protein [Nocardioides mangrovi]MBZ5738933.1 DUF881 domain-containing protein [Nocardioides mangrovi]